jgi:hypothetical protein
MAFMQRKPATMQRSHRVCCSTVAGVNLKFVCVLWYSIPVPAGLCGGSGIVPGGNIGENVAVFEQVRKIIPGCQQAKRCIVADSS